MLSSKATWQESNLHVQCCNYSLMPIRQFICKWMKTWIWLIDIHESQQTQPNHQLEYEWNDHKHVSWNNGWSFLHADISSSFHSSRMDWWDEDDGSSSDSSRQHSTSNKQLDDQWERSCQWNAQGLTCQIYYWCKDSERSNRQGWEKSIQQQDIHPREMCNIHIMTWDMDRRCWMIGRSSCIELVQALCHPNSRHAGKHLNQLLTSLGSMWSSYYGEYETKSR